MKFQILVDSASDLAKDYIKNKDILFNLVPLSLGVGDKEFIDDEKLDVDEMLDALKKTKEKSRSACPSPEDFGKYLNKADYTFIITITSKLSGCFNSAMVARNDSSNKDKILVIDSKATCGTEILIIDKLVEFIEQGKEFEEIVEKIEKYRDELNLLFILQKFDNLIANGRMSKTAGFIASTLVIRPICKADDGEIKIAKKVIGVKNAFAKLVKMIGEECPETSGKTLIISHCKADDEAKELKQEIEKNYKFKKIRIYNTKGLASFYALEKGVIVCF